MPDQYLRFTPEEAVAWLGEREAHLPADADEDPAGVGWYVAGVLGAAAICIVLVMAGTMIYAILYGLAHPQIASNVTRPSVQSRRVPAHVMRRAGFHRSKQRSPRSPEPEEGYLPAGWSMGCLAQDQPLASGINGTRIGTIPKATRLLYQISNAADWRLVVSADGSFWGYMCIRPQFGVPKRTLMRPEYANGVALIHRLENSRIPGEGWGQIRRTFANTTATPWGEEH